MQDGFVNIILYLSYILIVVTLLAALILPLINALDDPKSLAKMGFGVLAMGVLFLIGYLLSGSEVTEVYAQFEVGPELSKFVGGLLSLSYILIAISMISILFVEISKLTK